MFPCGFSERLDTRIQKIMELEFLRETVFKVGTLSQTSSPKSTRLGAKPDDPFLNVIGRDDDYLASQSPLNRGYRVTGNCADALFKIYKCKGCSFTKYHTQSPKESHL